jgi:hypothetical protein
LTDKTQPPAAANHGHRLSEAFDELKEKLKKDESGDDREKIKAPDDLTDRVDDLLKQHPRITWHRAVELVIDPSAPQDEEEESGGDDDDDIDDEALSDIDE